MPGPYSAGTIFLQIVPSFRDVPEAIAREGREIERELNKRLSKGASEGIAKGIKDGVEKGARDSQAAMGKAGQEAGEQYAGKFRKSLSDGVASMQRELRAIKLDVDDADAVRKFDALKKAAKNLGADIRMGVDSGLVFKEFQRILHRIEDIHDAAESIEFRSNIGGVIKDARKVHAAIDELNRLDIEPNLKIDRQLGAFERQFKDGIRRMLDDLPPVNLEVETGSAVAEIQAIRAALQALGDVELDVDMDSAKALLELAKIEARVKALADNASTLTIAADARSVERTVRELRDKLNQAAELDVRMRLIDEGFFQREVHSALEKASGAIGNLQIGVDLADIDSVELTRIKRELEDLQSKRIGVDIGAATALAEARRLEDVLNRISRNRNASFDIRSNAAAAAAELRKVNDEADKLDGRDLDIDVDVKGVKDLDRSLTKTSGALRNLGGEMQRSASQANDNANSFRAFNIRILGVAAVGPAVIPVLGAIGGGLFALGPLAATAAAGLGVLTLGLWGVGDAFKAMGDAQTNAAVDARTHAESVRTASNSVRDAERSLEDARVSGSRSAVDAQERVESSLRNVEDAQRGVIDAEKSLADAQRDAQQAQEDLTEARRDAIEAQEDLQLRSRDSVLDERKARLELLKNEKQLRETLAAGQGKLTDEEWAIKLGSVQYDVDKAKYDIDRAVEAQGDFNAELEEFARTGVEGSDQVVAAQDRLRQANERVADSQQGILDAQQRVADAQRGVADARRDQAEAAVDSQRRIEDSQRALTEAQLRYTEALDETSTSQQKLLDTMAKLGPAGQAFVTYLDGLRPFFQELRGIAQEGLLPGFQSWIDSMVGYHGPLLKRTVEGISGALGDMFDGFGRSFRGEAFTGLFQMIEQDGPRFIGYMRDVLINVGEAIADLIVASEPLADIFGEYLVDITRDWADAMRDLSSSTGWQEFIEYFRRILPEVEQFISGLVRAVLNLAVALGPYSEGLLNVLTGILNWVAGLDPQILGPIATALFVLVTAMQSIFGITSLLVSVRVASHLAGISAVLGGATGTTALAGGLARQLGFLFGAATLIVGALALMYFSNEDFRESMNKLFGALGDVVGAIMNGLNPLVETAAELLGGIATIVADVLTPVLGGLADLIGNNADLIGALVAGFVAFKGALMIAGLVTTLARALSGLAASMALVARVQMAGGLGAVLGGAGAAGAGGLLARAGGAAGLARMGGAAAGLGYVALSGFNALPGSDPGDNYDRPDRNVAEDFIGGVFQDETFTNEDVNGWAQRIMQGGSTAAELRNQYASDSNESIGSVIGHASTWWNESPSDRVAQYRAAEQAAHDYYYSLDELGQAQASAEQWQNELNFRTRQYGRDSEEARIASERYEYWTNRVAAAQGLAATETHRNTQSTQEYTDSLRAQYDTQFAYSQQASSLEQAQKNLAEAYAMSSATAEESALRDQAIATALANVEQQTMATADAARARFEAEYSYLPEQERNRLATAAQVAELNRLEQQYGALPPGLAAYRDELAATVDPADMLRSRMYQLGLDIKSIPDNKSFTLDPGTSAEDLQAVRDMGFNIVETLDGFVVTPQTEDAYSALEQMYQDWQNRPLVITAQLVEQAVAPFQYGGAGFDPRFGAGQAAVGAPPRAAGGAIFGPGSGTSDSILARVSNGEYIVRAAAVRAVGLDTLQKINSLGGYSNGGPVRKQGFPAFEGGGYVANFGGTINAGDLGGLGRIFLKGMGQSVQIVAQGTAMMSDLFGKLAATMSASASTGAAVQIGIWGKLFQALATQADRATGAVRGTFGSLQALVPLVSGIASGILGVWSKMNDRLVMTTQATGTTLMLTWMGTTLSVRTQASDMANFVVGEFNGMAKRLGAASAAARFAIAFEWNQIPGTIAKPINFVIDAVLNRGLFNAFNSIVSTMGLPKDWAMKSAPLAPTYLAAGGKVPGWSPNDRADNIPAMLTAGEFVQPVDVVRHYGVDFMEALRKKQINPMDLYAEGNPRRYATGGRVLPAGTVQRLAYGGVMNHVAAAGDEVRRIFGQLPGGIGGVGQRANASDHPQGLALDFMTMNDRALGDRIADYLYANGPRLALSYEIWKQRIRYPGGAWKGMENRGSITANHFDHVHASFMRMLGMVGTDPGGGGAPMYPAWYDEFGGSADGVRKKLDFSTLPAVQLAGLFGASNLTGVLGAMPTKAVDQMWSKMGPEVTRMFADAAAGAASGMIGALAPASGATGPVVDIVRNVARSRGWADGNEWNALARLVQKESSWNPNAQNPTSTAYGLFQFLNSTWGGTGIGKTSDPRLQAEAGMRYIQGRYGTPSKALAFHNANNWYSEGGEVTPELHDSGGVIHPGLNFIMNKTKGPEVSLPITPGQLENLVRAGESGLGGQPLIGELNLPIMPAATPEAVASEVVHRIGVAQRGGGKYGRS